MSKSKKNLLSFGSRSFVLTAAIIVILGGIISGTVAWMFIKSEPVNNTFTYGDMKVELTESDTGLDDDGKNDTNSYSLTPDAQIAKDPIVTIAAGTVDCWVFVKAETSDNFDDYMTYDMAEGWTKLEDGVYYRKALKSDKAHKITVIEGNIIKVKSDVTQQMLDELEEDDYPTIEFTAYAVQLSDLENAKDAWKAAEGK